MAKINCFEDLEVWKLSRKFTKDVFKISNKESFSKDYRFKEQIKSSSGSIMDNIAEGFERGGNKEFVQFLYIAKGSCGETRSQLYRALDYSFISQEEFEILSDKAIRISQSLSNFIRYIKDSDLKGEKYK